MATTATAPAPTSGAPHRSAATDLSQMVGRAALCAGLLGLGLGTWCRSFVEGTGGVVGVSVAQLGAPWVLVAFVVGAIVAVPRPADPAVGWAGVALGGLAGAGSMVVASFSYYGDASSASAVFWATAGILVGGAAGLAGAAWRTRPGGILEAMAAGALGLALVAEGIGRLDYGWFHSGGSQVSDRGSLWLVCAGLVVPILLTRGRPAGWLAAGSVLALAPPVAALVVASSQTLGLA